MKKTTNLGLVLYDPEDKFNITAKQDSLNHNMELLDAAVSEKSSVFEAEYGVTSFDEIAEAYDAGKIVCCRVNGVTTMHLGDIDTNRGFALFACHGEGPSLLAVTCTRTGGWSIKHYNMASLEDIDSAISGIDLETPINEALTQAKESGDFNGSDGCAVMVFEGSSSYNISADGLTVSFDCIPLQTKYGRRPQLNDLVLFGSKMFKVTAASMGGASGAFLMDIKGADGQSIWVADKNKVTYFEGNYAYVYCPVDHLEDKYGKLPQLNDLLLVDGILYNVTSISTTNVVGGRVADIKYAGSSIYCFSEGEISYTFNSSAQTYLFSQTDITNKYSGIKTSKINDLIFVGTKIYKISSINYGVLACKLEYDIKPVKGVDYFTEEDIAEIVDRVYERIANGN
jgi:hypothetical protein